MASNNFLTTSFLVSFILLGTESGFSQETQKNDSRKQQVEKLMEASLSNSLAIDTGDVLWRRVVYFDSTQIDVTDQEEESGVQLGKVVQSESFHRLFFDVPNHRFCYIVKSIVRVEDFETDKPAVNKISWLGLVDDRGKNVAYSMDSPGKVHKYTSSNDKSSPASSFRIPDLRVPQISAAGSRGIRDLRNDIQGFVRMGKVKELSRTKSVFEATIEWPQDEAFIGDTDKKEKHSNYSMLRYDADSFQLKEAKMWSVGTDGSQYKGGSFRINWEEKNGVFVPTSISGFRASQVTILGDATIGEEETNNRFHWFSVNSDLNSHDGAFRGEAFKSLEALEALIDPKKANATSLIEKMPKVEMEKSAPK